MRRVLGRIDHELHSILVELICHETLLLLLVLWPFPTDVGVSNDMNVALCMGMQSKVLSATTTMKLADWNSDFGTDLQNAFCISTMEKLKLVHKLK